MCRGDGGSDTRAAELSMASSGLTTGWTIMFSSLGMSADYVGFFSVAGVFVRNASAALCVTFRMLEQAEAATRWMRLTRSSYVLLP
jgi:hypothetical protein